MSNLLTHEEYQAIARNLPLPLNAYVNGKFAAPRSELCAYPGYTLADPCSAALDPQRAVTR